MGKLIRFLLALTLLWGVGLFIFVTTLPNEGDSRSKLAQSVSSSKIKPGKTGIAVYTGGGGIRIAKAMNLFSEGIAERLLVSGVHPETTEEHLEKLWTGDKNRYACCLDLGLEAQTTRGNAEELIAWANNNSYSTIVLVTSDYHMPRALAETQALVRTKQIATNMAVIPYAVQSSYLKQNGIPRDLESLKILGTEYSKFLLARSALLRHQFWF